MKARHSKDDHSEWELFKAIATLKNADEVSRFFLDLCTPAERQAMADRWKVVPALLKEIPYRTIHEQTGVSVTTIGRVARCLIEGEGGYQLAVERKSDKR